MDSKEYIYTHDFGFGRKKERKNLKKLMLRNVSDLEVYLHEIIRVLFNAEILDDLTFRFTGDKVVTKIYIEEKNKKTLT